MEENKVKQKTSGWAIAAFIIGIVGISLSFIPIVNNASFFLGALAVIFGIIGVAKKKVSKVLAIIALVLGIASIIITISLQSSWSKSLDETSKKLDKTFGSATEEVLAEDVKVEIGTFQCSTDQYGLTDTKLELKVTNITDERQSYNFTIEALDPNGSRIDTDTVFANDVAPDQTVTCQAFTLVTSDTATALQNATFTIIEASAY